MRLANGKGDGITPLDVEILRLKLQDFFKKETLVHVSLNVGRKKTTDIPSKIINISNHFFSVSPCVKSYVGESLTISFVDILIGKFKIKELEEVL